MPDAEYEVTISLKSHSPIGDVLKVIPELLKEQKYDFNSDAYYAFLTEIEVTSIKKKEKEK